MRPATKLLTEFQQTALVHPNEEQLTLFPETIARNVGEHLAIFGDLHL